MLTLQKDIDSDNHSYYENEKQRLQIQARSTALKLEELCRRADEKQRQINDIAKKVHGGNDVTGTSIARADPMQSVSASMN